MSKKKVLLRGVFINRDTNGEGVLKVGTTLIRVSTVVGILYLFAGTNIDIDEKEEVIDMCKAWEEQKNEGREEGREEGRIRQAKITALKLQKKGHSIEDIAECVDFDEETVKKWLVS